MLTKFRDRCMKAIFGPDQGKRAGTQARTGSLLIAKVPSIRARNRKRKHGQVLTSPSSGSLSLLVCHKAGIRGDQHLEVPAVSSLWFIEK